MRAARQKETPGARDVIRQVVLGKDGGRPRLVEAPPPSAQAGEAVFRTLLTGIDGTDEELLREGAHVELPPGRDHMVMGHECLAEVVEAPQGCGLAPGDRVVPLVRHGCGVCALCARGHQDMCSSGRYREHGIKGLDGFMRDLWTDDPATVVKAPAELGDLAALAEPVSIVVKAVEAAEAIQRRVPWFDGFGGQRVLLAGTGSLGTLAAFLLVEQGAQVWGMDRADEAAEGSRLLAALGVRHVNARETDVHDVAREVGGFDLVLEATGVPRLALDLATTLDANGALCLLGVPPEKGPVPLEADDVMRRLVLGNGVMFGSVNSGRGHFERALAALGRWRARWPDLVERVVTHRFSPEEVEEAFRADDRDLVRKVVDWR